MDQFSEMKVRVRSIETVNNCGLCNEKKAKYTCPKCGVLFCSLICYRSYCHTQCSENFFKEFVLKELENRNQQPHSVQEMRRKIEILLLKDKENNVHDPDSDDSEDCNQEDLLERMKNIDLNDSDAVWNNLSEKERADFHKTIISGQITEFLPKWDPWWVITSNNLVEDLETSRPPDIPPIKNGIPLLSTMMSKKPNEAVVNGLVNIMYGYACVSRLFMQDWTGNANSIIEILLNISEILIRNMCFKTPQEALDHAHSAALKLHISQHLRVLVKCDTVQILKQKKFVLASLSDVSELLHKGIDGNFTPKKRLLVSMKKVEFYMCFANEYGVNLIKP